MRIDELMNIQSVYQQQKQRRHKQLVLVGLGVMVLAYLGVLGAVYKSSKDTKVVSSQAAVAGYEGAVFQHTDAMSVPAVGTPTIMAGVPRFSGNTALLHTYAPQGGAAAPQHTWQSTGVALTVHTTSSAVVHNIGGGGSGGGATGGGGSVAGSAFAHSTSSMVVPTLAWSSSRSLSVDNTRAAREAVIDAGTAEKTGGTIHTVYGTPEDFYEDEIPVGNGLWVLLFLAAGYGAFSAVRFSHRRKQRV